MDNQIRVAYDISLLGAGYISQQSRTGIFRAIEETLLALKGRSTISVSPIALNKEATIWDDISSRLYCENEQPGLLVHYNKTYRSRLHLTQMYTALVNCQKALISASNSRKSILYKTGRALEVSGSHLAQKEALILRDAYTYDVYHGAYFPLPDSHILPNTPRILTVYDLIPVLFPKFVIPKVYQRTVKMLKSINIKKDWVVCISEHTKQDFCRYTGMKPNRVFVVPLAASTDFHPVEDASSLKFVLNKYKIPDSPYLLSLCTLEPRKNLDMLVAAFANYVEINPTTDLNLVLVGISGWKNNQIFRAVQDNPSVKQRIILTGYVPDDHLAHVYTGALAFVYPSLYEGFGLPPLEAMQCGTPVIAADSSSIPEVVGNAGILIDSTNRSELTDAIEQLVRNPSLRATLSRKALQRARQFSWAKVAEATISVYEVAISSKS